jgi:hypothetical protein
MGLGRKIVEDIKRPTTVSKETYYRLGRKIVEDI